MSLKSSKEPSRNKVHDMAQFFGCCWQGMRRTYTLSGLQSMGNTAINQKDRPDLGPYFWTAPLPSSWAKFVRAQFLFGVLAWSVSVPLLQAAGDSPPATHFQSAVMNLRQGQVDKALTEINLAATAAPKDGNIQILKALILFENNHFAESQALLKPLLTGGAYTLRARTVEAEILLRHKDFTRSASYYSAVLPQCNNPVDIARIQLRLLYCAVGQSDWLGASKLLVLLKPSDAHFPGFYFGEAAISTGLNDPKKAADQIQSARTLYGNASVDDELELFIKVFDSGKPAISSTPAPGPGNPVPASK